MEVLLWWLISRSKKPTQNLKKFLEIWNSSQITLQTCVLILVEEFLGFCPCWWKVMKKFKDLSRKSYLEAWNPSLFIKFVIINTSNGFSYIKFNQTLPIFKPKKLLFFLKSWPHVCQLTNQKTKLHLNMTNDDQLKSWAWRTNSNMKKVNKLFFFAIMRWVTFSSVLLD